MTTLIQYNIHDFEKIKSEGFDFSFDKSVINIIQDISEKVGAPGYIKTPTFAKKKKEKIHIAPTVFKAEIKSMFDEIKVEIRKSMNKISEETYDSIYSDLTNKIDALKNEQNKSEEKLHEEMLYIGKLLFDLATFNHFYAPLYAKLYRDLMDSYEIFTNILESTFTTFTSVFENIVYVSANDDYEKYCQYNSKKEVRKALTTFISHLFKLDVIEEEYVISLINKLYEQFNHHIENSEMKHLCDEISENIKLIICNCLELLMKIEDWSSIEEMVNNTCAMKPRIKPGFTSKALFCYYDTRDAIKKMNTI